MTIHMVTIMASCYLKLIALKSITYDLSSCTFKGSELMFIMIIYV